MPPADVFFGCLASFLVGVFAASAGWNIALVFAGAFLAVIVLRIIRKVPIFISLSFLACIFIGAFYYHLYQNVRGEVVRIPFGEEMEFSGVVAREPRFTEKTQIVTLRLAEPLSGTVTALLPRAPEFRYGEILSLRGSIKPAEGNFLPTAVFPEVQSRSDAPPGAWIVKRRLIDLKLSFVGAFRRVLPVDSAALLAGITFGYQSDFSKAFKENMALSGATHLVALSGYNIAILVLAIARTFGKLFKRRTTFYLTTLVIILFVLMVGAEASVVRAAIMGFLVLFARESGRVYSFRNALALAAFVMALANPSVLVFDLGFQLSFLSLAGIVYLEPALHAFARKGNLPGGKQMPESFLAWRENFRTTLAAQLAVLPLLLHAFGGASASALLANMLILSVVPITMAVGFFLGAAAAVSHALGYVVALFANILLVYQVAVIDVFARVRLPVPAFLGGAGGALLYYAVLIAIIVFARRRMVQYEYAAP